MNNRILFIGLDVDDKAFHGYGISSDSGESIEFSCKPTVKSLQSKLALHIISGLKPRLCYEATFLGFSLYRRLKAVGVECDVIAPSLVPKTSGARVKTDRLDCKSLAEYYRSGLLTVVQVPDEQQEIHRDIIRSRHFLQNQVKSLKLHILSLCRRMDLNYKQETEKKNYWTTEHQNWLESKVRAIGDSSLQFNFVTLINQLNQLRAQVESYTTKINRLAEEPFYQEKVKALGSYRGISTLTAMTLITEIGDVRRFSHPTKLTSYAGLDICEYSSGGKQKYFGITKMGNTHIRTSTVESVQRVYLKPHISKRLRRQRLGVESKFIDIADRCMNRLYKKGQRLFMNGKHKNKIKIACARELLCFVWESLMAVQNKSLVGNQGDVETNK